MNSFISKDLWHNHASAAQPGDSDWMNLALELYQTLTSRAAADTDQEKLSKAIDQLASQLDPLLSLHDEVGRSAANNNAHLYGLVKKFQKENRFLHDKFTEKNTRLQEQYEKNKSLDKTNSELILKIGTLEQQNKNLRTLGLYSIMQRLRGMLFK